MLFLHEGTPNSVVDENRARQLVRELIARLRTRGPLHRVLVIPPDITRLHSGAGFLTGEVFRLLAREAEIVILPALGTHTPMTDAERERMFPGIPPAYFRVHDWRQGVVTLGEIPAEELRRLSNGHVDMSAKVQLNRMLVEEPWDLILSIGQLVPHEVIGIANHVKNLFVGVGGSDLINKSHWLGAVVGIEKILGQSNTPVRSLLSLAWERFGRTLPVVFLLTVRSRMANGEMVTRGLFAGDDHECYLRGSELCQHVNLDRLEKAPRKVVVYLDPVEYKTTWLGNKAIYRTRMAIADQGELVVLAPGVHRFGEDPLIDRFIREFGYRGTTATLNAVRSNPALAQQLSAAAHLIHGSSEGRFTITYAPGQMSQDEIEGVGYRFGCLSDLLKRYPPDQLQNGWNRSADGEEFFYISNPALGLWTCDSK